MPGLPSTSAYDAASSVFPVRFTLSMPSVSMPMFTRVGVTPTVLLVKLAPVPIVPDEPHTDREPIIRATKKSVREPVQNVFPVTLVPVKSRGSSRVVTGDEPGTTLVSGRSRQVVGTIDWPTPAAPKYGVAHSPIGSVDSAAKAELPALRIVLPETRECCVAGTLPWSASTGAAAVEGGSAVIANAGVPPPLTVTVRSRSGWVTNGAQK